MGEEQGFEMNKEDNSSKSEGRSNKNINKAKSCKGCLYYSSQLKTKHRNPLCVGFSRALQQGTPIHVYPANVPKLDVTEIENAFGKKLLPNYVEVGSDIEASNEGRSLDDFKYACVGYSAYANKKDTPADQHGQAELPYCVGIELLVDRRASAGTPAREHEHAHRKEDTPVLPRPPSTHRPPHTIGDEFLSRFYRNSGLVAGGVARNLYRVGNYIKANLDDILYPYRRRPK